MQGDLDRHPATRLVAFWRVGVVGLGTVVVPMDTLVNVAFPDIVRHFALPIPAIQWIVIAYVLTQTSLLLVFGRIADMIGHRRVFGAGAAVSAVAFVACATAPAYGWLIGARVLQGVGAGLLLCCGPALITSLFPERQRVRMLALYTLIFGAGQAVGPPLAGLLVAAHGWSAVYWCRAPLSLLAALLVPSLPAVRPAGRRAPFDAAGAVLLIVSVTAALLTLNRLQHARENALAILLLLAVAAVGFALFARAERRAARPIIDLAVFRRPGFLFINLAAALLNIAGFAVLLLGPFYLARLAWLSLPETGLVLGAAPAGLALAAPLAARIASRRGPFALARIGMVAMALGLATIAALPPLPLLVAAMFVQGAGLGIFQLASLDVITATLPPQDRGVAGSLAMLSRTLGLMAGATLLMLVFQTVRGAAGGAIGGDAAFLAGFRAAFLAAAAVPALLLLPALRLR